jgi:ATP-dependent Zn protease
MRNKTLKAMRSARDLRETAYHEAGHAVAGCVLGLGMSSKGMHIVPEQEDGGVTFGATSVRPPRPNVKNVQKWVVMLLCGGLAAGLSKGFEVKKQGTEHDLLEINGHLDSITDSHEEKTELGQALCHEARELLHDNWPAVQSLVGELLAKKTLTGKHVELIVSEAL